MTTNNKIGIKLEIYKDKNSGQLSIITHFNANSPNVIIDKNEYVWFPTPEEKELINESFNLVPSTKLNTTSTQSSYHETLDKSAYEPDIKGENTPPMTKQTEDFDQEKDDLSEEEQSKEPVVFEVTGKETIEKETVTSDKEPDNIKQDESKNDEEKPEEKKIIVEADEDAIKAAIEKHANKDEDNESMVEADEQTIIDRVLKQKKKGKWSKIK